MRPLLKVFFTGLLISFLGSLPLATTNIAAMQISISDSIGSAMLFSLGSLTIEIIYVRISLVAITWIQKQKRLFKILEYVTLMIILALAVSSFYAAMHPEVHKNPILSSTLPKFLLGFTMGAVSPAQFPFWLGWSTVLFTKKILLPRNDYYNSYIVGIGIGTFISNCVFIFGGLLIANKINNSQNILHWVIGSIFLATALLQIWQMIRRKSSADKFIHPTDDTDKMGKRLGKIIKKDR
jgi:threonine/homoserine/homoserine lactone efflux protein